MGCAPKRAFVTDEHRVIGVVAGLQPTGTNGDLRLPKGGNFAILPRARWAGAQDKPSTMAPMGEIYRLTIHHEGNAAPNDILDPDEVAARIRNTFDGHKNGRGWSDIGYHFTIDRAGRIWELRSLQWQGAHAGNPQVNKGNVGIEVMGNFNLQKLNSAQKAALTHLVDKLCAEYGISAGHVYTHGELWNTDCPGRDLQAFVDRRRLSMKKKRTR